MGFEFQNKVLPGVYINVSSTSATPETPADSGIATFALETNWMKEHAITIIDVTDDITAKTGYDITAPENKLIKEVFKRAKTLLFYRLDAGGTKATQTDGTITATAKYTGERGNGLSVEITQSLTAGEFIVNTLLDARLVATETAQNIEDLTGNEFIVFTGTGTIPVAILVLIGGTNGTSTNADHTQYLNAIKFFRYNTMGYIGVEPDIKSIYASYAKLQREDEDIFMQCVINDYDADTEAVINTISGVHLNNGTYLEPFEVVAWVVGASAGAKTEDSNTNTVYEDAIQTDIFLTKREQVDYINEGKFVLKNDNRGVVRVIKDINSLTTFTATKNYLFSKNHIIRTIDKILNSIKDIFEKTYLGKEQNTPLGRSNLKASMTSILSQMQGLGAINTFSSENDVTVLLGGAPDAVVGTVRFSPTDVMEVLYLTATVTNDGGVTITS